MIKAHKKRVTPEELCLDLPTPFRIMFRIVRDMGFEETPDYDKLRKGLKAVIGPCYTDKPIFDWNYDSFKKGGGLSEQIP